MNNESLNIQHNGLDAAIELAKTRNYHSDERVNCVIMLKGQLCIASLAHYHKLLHESKFYPGFQLRLCWKPEPRKVG